MNQELVRIIDGIAREKNIETEAVFTDLEAAMVSAVRKQYDQADEVQVSIDRLSGTIQASRNGQALSVNELGRIAAQTAKQVMIQKLREDERGSILEEYEDRKGSIVTGTVSRFESGSMVVNLGRTEGFLPRSEQIPGETHHPGERIRALILEVREVPHQVKIILSRTHPDFIRRLFELEVPEVSERIIELKALAREPGYRTKVAVSSIDLKVDPVGACVGVRGSRIKNIVDELGGEKIDIVRWNESSQVLIRNALRPAEVVDIALCFELGRATVVVNEDQLSLAIGKRGQNVRLAARLTGWDTEILTPKEYNAGLEAIIATLRGLEEYMDDTKVDRVIAMGMINLLDIEEVGQDPFVQELELTEEQAADMVSKASAAAKIFAVEQEKAKAAEAAKAAEEAEAIAKDKAAIEAAGETPDEEALAIAKDRAAIEAAGETSDQEEQPEEAETEDAEQDNAPADEEVEETEETEEAEEEDEEEETDQVAEDQNEDSDTQKAQND